MTKWHICIVFPTSRADHDGLFWKKIMQKKSEIQFFERKYEQKKVLLKAYGKFSLRRNMQINR